MNAFVKFASGVACLAFSMSLMSCEKNLDLAPQNPTTADPKVTPVANGGIIVSIPKVYKLIMYGDNKLTYNAAGKLVKVVAGGVANEDSIVYTHSAGKISFAAFGNNQLSSEGTFTLDAKNRCIESVTTTFTYFSYGTIVNESKFKFEYNAGGQLIKRTNLKKPTERNVYSYDGNGNLMQIDQYNESGVLFRRNTYEYQVNGSALLDDLYPMNADYLLSADFYLKGLYGKFSKNLIRRRKITKLPANTVDLYWQYNHILNQDGYVTSTQTQSVSNGQQISNTPFGWLVTNIAVLP